MKPQSNNTGTLSPFVRVKDKTPPVPVALTEGDRLLSALSNVPSLYFKHIKQLNTSQSRLTRSVMFHFPRKRLCWGQIQKTFQDSKAKTWNLLSSLNSMNEIVFILCLCKKTWMQCECLRRNDGMQSQHEAIANEQKCRVPAVCITVCYFV